MARFSKITRKLLNETVSHSDLNSALFHFQSTIGIDSGDVAGRVFGTGWDDEWPTAPADRRHEMMKHYIELERFYAQP